MVHSNDKYIGVIIYWLTLNFKIYDIILVVKNIEYLYTSEWIKKYLHKKIKEYELSEKIVYA